MTRPPQSPPLSPSPPPPRPRGLGGAAPPLGGPPSPPLSALLSLPGHLLGDHRYSLIAATIVSAALMAWLRPGPLPAGAAALLLFTPRRFFVLEQGFTEPYVVLALTCVVLFARRVPKALPYEVGP